MAIESLTQAQAAALLGVTTRRLRQIEETDDVGRANDGSYPPDAFGRWLRSREDRLDPAQERAQLDRQRRLDLERKAAIDEGQLIPIEQVAEAWAGQVRVAKERLMSLPARLAPSVTRQTEMRETEKIIREAIHGVLTELADGS